MNRGVAWYKLKDGLIHKFQDFFDTEIIAAFWPNGAPCSDFPTAENAVEHLTYYASVDALAHFNQHVFVEGRMVISGREAIYVLGFNTIYHAI